MLYKQFAVAALLVSGSGAVLESNKHAIPEEEWLAMPDDLKINMYVDNMEVDNKKVDTMKVVRILEGILVGAILAEFDDLTPCIHGFEHVETDIANAVHNFQRHSARGVLAGMKNLCTTLKDLVNMIR